MDFMNETLNDIAKASRNMNRYNFNESCFVNCSAIKRVIINIYNFEKCK